MLARTADEALESCPGVRSVVVLRRTGGAIYPKTALIENVEFFLVAAIVILGIRTYFVQPFKIPTNSMWPTYNGMTPQVYKTADDELYLVDFESVYPARGPYHAALLGTPRQYMIGNVIESKFLSTQDSPQGAALSFILMALILIGVFALLTVRLERDGPAHRLAEERGGVEVERHQHLFDRGQRLTLLDRLLAESAECRRAHRQR